MKSNKKALGGDYIFKLSKGGNLKKEFRNPVRDCKYEILKWLLKVMLNYWGKSTTI